MKKRGRRLYQTRALIAAQKMGLDLRNPQRFLQTIARYGPSVAFSDARFLAGLTGGWIVPRAFSEPIVRMAGERRVWVNDREVDPDSVKLVMMSFFSHP